MKTYSVAPAGLTVSSVILGMMRIAKMDNDEIARLVETALDAGITVFDHADIYGGERHRCEERFGEAVRLSADQRDGVLIQSKVGIRKGFYDFSAAHILASVEGSLKALRTDYLDVLLLHRPDALVEPEEVAEAFDALHQAGKVRHFGVSNHTPGQIDLLKTAVRQKLVFNQMQLSIPHAPMIAQGVAANIAGLDQAADRDNGLIDYSRINSMTLQAWSPFQSGVTKGVFIGDREHYRELNTVLDELAETHKVTPGGIAVAWITRHPANIQVVLGTTTPERVREAAAGSEVRLDREDWYRLFRTAGHKLP